jgi:hypothetical protein
MDEMVMTFLGPDVDPDEIRRAIAMLESRLPAPTTGGGVLTPQLALIELLQRKI